MSAWDRDEGEPWADAVSHALNAPDGGGDEPVAPSRDGAAEDVRAFERQ
ncbi:hypothetical protein [Streptomyces sp. Tu 3180]|nr:hypothetical protein [Streptomyces sp. Tu 3180]